jgi:hypothetical protein
MGRVQDLFWLHLQDICSPSFTCTLFAFLARPVVRLAFWVCFDWLHGCAVLEETGNKGTIECSDILVYTNDTS